jgi:hypothetical protein
VHSTHTSLDIPQETAGRATGRQPAATRWHGPGNVACAGSARPSDGHIAAGRRRRSHRAVSRRGSVGPGVSRRGGERRAGDGGVADATGSSRRRVRDACARGAVLKAALQRGMTAWRVIRGSIETAET